MNKTRLYLQTMFLTVFLSTYAHTTTWAAENELNFSVIVTAESGGSVEALVVKGGGWLTPRRLVHSAVLVTHPKGDFLWDSGIGREISTQMETFSFFDKQLFHIENIYPARQQLEDAAYSVDRLVSLIPSHMHWDHASGLEDFIGIPVWVQKQEHEAAFKGEVPAYIRAQFDSPAIQWRFIELAEQPYLGFAKSLDLYQDGSVILVDLSGHTPGQLGMFLNRSKDERYFFIGDTTWTILGINNNRGRPKIVDYLVGVDHDLAKNDSVITAIHELTKQYPEIKIIPAHDEFVTSALPRFPEFLP